MKPIRRLQEGSRYLEPHGLPVGRLDVLEVVRLLLVVLVYLFAEEGYSVPASEYFS